MTRLLLAASLRLELVEVDELFFSRPHWVFFIFYKYRSQRLVKVECGSTGVVESVDSERTDLLPTAKGVSVVGRRVSESLNQLHPPQFTSGVWRYRVPSCCEVTDNNRCLHVPTAAGRRR